MVDKAFVLINTARGKEAEVATTLLEREGVTSVHQVTGPYEIIAGVEADDLEALGQLIISLRPTKDNEVGVQGITGTITLAVLEEIPTEG